MAKTEIRETETKLMAISAAELIDQLDLSEEQVVNMKQCAFEHFSATKGTFYQVQVTVTKSEREFIGAFETEVTKQY